MKIYEAEKSIAELITNNTSVAFTSEAKIADPCENTVNEKVLARLNINQPDLYYIESVLVSTNWNGNDDIFTKAETFPARNSPVDKQFNFMHNEKDIIGHITSSYVINAGEKVLSENIDEVPDFFDIVTGAVLYKHWTDPELKNRMQQIIAEIPEGKWFVSMEALFNDFDYAVLVNGEQKIISRNEETSFLSKHLRAYGGSGVYNENRIGRVLKNIVFSGKGLVNKPANKRSHIKSYSFNGTFASLEETFGSKLMSDTVSKQEFDSVKAELETLRAEAEKARAKEVEEHKAVVATLTKEKEALAQEKAELEQKLQNTEALSKEKSDKLESVEAAMKEKDDKMAEMKKNMDKMKKEKAKSERVSALVEAGVDSVKAAEVADKFESADEEMFSEVVALYKNKMKEEKGMCKTDKEDKSKADEESAEAEQLDDVEEETSASLGSETDETEEYLTKASAWVSEVWGDKE